MNAKDPFDGEESLEEQEVTSDDEVIPAEVDVVDDVDSPKSMVLSAVTFAVSHLTYEEAHSFVVGLSIGFFMGFFTFAFPLGLLGIILIIAAMLLELYVLLQLRESTLSNSLTFEMANQPHYFIGGLLIGFVLMLPLIILLAVTS